MQIDFTPAVYEHAAALIGRTPFEVSRDAGLLFNGHAEAFRTYRHAPIVVGIDIYNLEAEAYGATIDAPAGNGIPAISAHPLTGTADIRDLAPLNPKADGRIPLAVETGRQLADAFPEADVRIPVSGPFSLAGNLVGFDRLLCDIMDDPASVEAALRHLARGQLAFCREIVDRGLGIAFFESGATPPLISPQMFAQIELPVLKLIISEASAIAGHPVPCIIGGNTEPILDSMLETGTGHLICPCETDQDLFMHRMRAFPDVRVRINTGSAVYSSGDPANLHHELDRVLALAAIRDNVCIGTGALPFEADPGLVLEAKAYLRAAGSRATPGE